jgi:lipopolysaccharide biosynthesis glycosyltransferase
MIRGKFWLYFNRFRRLFVNIFCGFIPSKKLRFRLRSWILFPAIEHNPKSLAVLESRAAKNTADSSIDVAFCFDENVVEQAKLSIVSLLRSAGSVSYNIYCLVPKNFRQSFKNELESIIKKQCDSSSITFLEANDDFEQSCKWKTPAIYYRLMLPRLLPHLDKIIYADVDTIFHNSLAEVNRVNLGLNLVAGVKDMLNVSSAWKSVKDNFLKRKLVRGEYINSGFLIMNLKELRIQNLYEKWVEISLENDHLFPDQNILNYTCKGKKLFLPLKYNFVPTVYARALLENVYSLDEYNEAIAHPIMVHYAGRSKELWNGGKYGAALNL